MEINEFKTRLNVVHSTHSYRTPVGINQGKIPHHAVVTTFCNRVVTNYNLHWFLFCPPKLGVKTPVKFSLIPSQFCSIILQCERIQQLQKSRQSLIITHYLYHI